MVEIDIAFHVHVGAGHDGLQGGVALILGKAMIDHFEAGAPVGHDESLKAPFALEKVALERAVPGCRDTVEDVERIHDGGGTSLLDRGPEGGQHDVVDGHGADIDRVIVAPGLSEAIAGKMLGGGGDGQRVREVVALKAAHAGDGDLRAEIGVFTCPLHDPAPARIAADVDHGGEGPVEAVGGGLCARDTGGLFHHVEVPASSLCERQREDGLVAVDDVIGEKDGNAETRLVDGIVLDGADVLEANDIQH